MVVIGPAVANAILQRHRSADERPSNHSTNHIARCQQQEKIKYHTSPDDVFAGITLFIDG